jgi:hypothetical protein
VLFTGQHDVKQPTHCIIGAIYPGEHTGSASRILMFCQLRSKTLRLSNSCALLLLAENISKATNI